MVLAEHDLDYYLTPKFNEPDLILSTSRALDSIGSTEVHDLWSNVLSGRLSEYSGELRLYMITNSGFNVNAIRFMKHLEGSNLDNYLRSLHEDKTYPFIRALKMSLRFVAICRIRHVMKRSNVLLCVT